MKRWHLGLGLLLVLATCIASLVLPAAAQDIELRMRQHQADARYRQQQVRQRIEEARARMERARQSMRHDFGARPGASTAAPSASYVRTYSHPQAQVRTTPTSAAPARYATGSSRVVAPATAVRSIPTTRSKTIAAPAAQVKAVAAPGVRSKVVRPPAAPVKTAAAPAAPVKDAIAPPARKATSVPPPGATAVRATGQNAARSAAGKAAASGKPAVQGSSAMNLDVMPVNPPKAPYGAGFNQAGWLRGMIAGAIFGGLTGGLVALLMQLVRLFDPSEPRLKTWTIIALALAVPAGAAVSRSHLDLIDKIPFVSSLVPAEAPTSELPRKFADVRSDAFQFVASMPQPMNLERKEVNKVWTVTVGHIERDGAFMLNYARLPSPEEMFKMANPYAVIMPKSFTFDVEKGLDGAAKQSVEHIRGETTSCIKITVDGHSARDVQGKLPDNVGLFHQIIILTNGNFYQLGVLGKPDFVQSPDATKFLYSLRFASR